MGGQHESSKRLDERGLTKGSSPSAERLKERRQPHNEPQSSTLYATPAWIEATGSPSSSSEALPPGLQDAAMFPVCPPNDIQGSTGSYRQPPDRSERRTPADKGISWRKCRQLVYPEGSSARPRFGPLRR